MSEKSAFSASDFLTGESEKAANDNKMNKSILKYRSESPLSRDLGVKDKLANVEASTGNPGENLS
jgi:hypothetical protein